MSTSQPSTQDVKLSTLIEFPFQLQSELNEFTIAEDLLVRRMDDGDKARLLRIANVQYNENGKLSSYAPLSNSSFLDLPTLAFAANYKFYSSNYLLITPSLERAKEFNIALKLIDNSHSALYIGFMTTGSGWCFLNPPCFYGENTLIVEQAEIQKLTTLIAQIERARSDKKFQTMIEIYAHTLAIDRRKESRFVELAVILEMLLLPDSSHELSYKFSLRIAKLLNRLLGENTSDIFENARCIYDTRSNLVHKGSAANLDAIAPIAYNYVRILLAAYLEDHTRFQKSNLDEMCLC